MNLRLRIEIPHGSEEYAIALDITEYDDRIPELWNILVHCHFPK
jgi:hypothetical protein